MHLKNVSLSIYKNCRYHGKEKIWFLLNICLWDEMDFRTYQIMVSSLFV
jgi:hypothetical protein